MLLARKQDEYTVVAAVLAAAAAAAGVEAWERDQKGADVRVHTAMGSVVDVAVVPHLTQP